MKIFNKILYLYHLKKSLIFNPEKVHVTINELFCVDDGYLVIYGFFGYDFRSFEYQIYANKKLNIRDEKHYIMKGLLPLYNDLMRYFHSWRFKGEEIKWETLDLYETI